MLKFSRFPCGVLKIELACLIAISAALTMTNCAGTSSPAPGTSPSTEVQPPSPVVPDGNTQPMDTPHILQHVRIAPFLLPCTAPGQQLCLVKLDDVGKPAEFISGPLGGFTFQWGHEYLLDIVIDQSGTMTLAKIQSDTPRSLVDSPGLLLNRNFVLSTQGYVSDNCEFTIAGQYALSVLHPDQCAQLNGLLSSPLKNKQGFRLQLDVLNPTLGKLQLRSLAAVTAIAWKELRFANTSTAITTFDSVGACRTDSGAVQNTFVIENNGSFVFLVCDRHIEETRGQLSTNELQNLNTLAQATMENSILEINCSSGQSRRLSQEIYVLSTEGDELSLMKMDYAGTCFRGERSRLTKLVGFISELQQHYNLRHLGPQALPL